MLVLAHRMELITQAHDKLVAASGQLAGYIKSGMSSNWDYPIQVASVQTLTRKNEYPEAGLIVIDEAHHSITRSYTRILEAYPGATPEIKVQQLWFFVARLKEDTLYIKEAQYIKD